MSATPRSCRDGNLHRNRHAPYASVATGFSLLEMLVALSILMVVILLANRQLLSAVAEHQWLNGELVRPSLQRVVAGLRIDIRRAHSVLAVGSSATDLEIDRKVDLDETINATLATVFQAILGTSSGPLLLRYRDGSEIEYRLVDDRLLRIERRHGEPEQRAALADGVVSWTWTADSFGVVRAELRTREPKRLPNLLGRRPPLDTSTAIVTAFPRDLRSERW